MKWWWMAVGVIALVVISFAGITVSQKYVRHVAGELIEEYDSVRTLDYVRALQAVDSLRARNDSILAVKILEIGEAYGRDTRTR